VLSLGGTFFAGSFQSFWEKAETAAATAAGSRLAETNPLRQLLALYIHSAGIENGYGYFAPNVPSNYKLVFELHYRDGRVEYDLPSVANATTGLRITNLYDNIRAAQHPAVRELMMRMLAFAKWQEHPEAIRIRAIFGVANLPPLSAFRQGVKESYETLYAYDFSFKPPAAQPDLSP
jgi:hypothetical protein